jgi:hypothetical protein
MSKEKYTQRETHRMTENQEIMIFGNCMYRIDQYGKKHHIPREQWDKSFKPEDHAENRHKAGRSVFWLP